MSMPLEQTDAELLLNAYIDGELDAASALALDKRLAAEPELAAARDRLMALRGLLRDKIPREAASARLRLAMAAQADAGAERMTVITPNASQLERALRPFGSNWRMALAACVVGAVSGAALTMFAMTPRSQAPAMAEVVADHLRAIMAPQPFDVASSDQHTVKPWFAGRLPFAPQVFDLAQAGFTLIGGRVDVLGGQPAATLVFRHGKHLISLIAQPTESGAPPSHGGAQDKGFLVRDWVSGSMRYWAISDISPKELDAFEAAARAQLAGAN